MKDILKRIMIFLSLLICSSPLFFFGLHILLEFNVFEHDFLNKALGTSICLTSILIPILACIDNESNNKK